MASGVARLVAGPIAIVGWLLVIAGLVVAQEKAPLADFEALRFRDARIVRVEGRITQVDETRWEMPPKVKGLGPLPIYRVQFRFLDANDVPHDGVSYTHGLWHRIRDPAKVEYVDGHPEQSRLNRAYGRPFELARAKWLLAPLPGLLIVALGALLARTRTAPKVTWILPIAALGMVAELVRAIVSFVP